MRLAFYKKGQGYYTRLGTALGLGVLSVLGCYALYRRLGGIQVGETITAQVRTWIQAGVPAALLGVLAWLVFRAVNHPKFADFMIATEGEMKKVSWSSKKEVIASTRIVLITVILLSVLLGVVDVFFTWVFQWVGVLKMVDGA